MRFRLHNQNAGQVKQNTTAIAALSSQVATQSATVTTQVTGDDDVHTVGTLAIDNAELTAVTFADAFSSNGISHALDASIFNVTTAGEYSINVEIRVTDGTINAAGLYWVVCRRYKNRTTTDTTGDAYRDYHLGGSYYRDHNAARDDVVLGGNARIHFESTTEQFEIIIRKSYQQNLSTGDLVIDNAVSYLNIEKHDAAGGVDVLSSVLSRLSELESRLGIDIVTGVNDTLVFQHYITSTASPNVITYTYTIVLAGQRYTTDEMLTAINAAIATQGSVQNAITTTMAFSGDRFIIRCTADTSVFFSIQVVQGSSSAAESIGFVQNRVQQGSTGGDLDLVATNTVLFAIRDAT